MKRNKGSKANYAFTQEQMYVNPSRRKPKYGYARNMYGNILERDHYVENRQVNSYNGSSMYDREDDNDSLYGMFE